ncbi:hypothetical protein GRF29_28g749644 [Pseudopithomyces chartarum]|uniref:EthD domain-containing protein n=1 Tax=Pseudopithomyces chartarum TaxID=1892770 RepID=A0AAN6RJW3_9PLEO|nr:hypothetical protein GRF29_28g749644 [Pseudopithomyces chartarum]
MTPGVIWVSSRISHLPKPRDDIPALTPEKFCDWYENTHIQEVTALPGVPRAARYEAIRLNGKRKTLSDEAPWLTIYEMPDIDYRMTEEFCGLDGQRAPRDDLLKGIFEQARFDTRFYEHLDAGSSASAFNAAKFIISLGSDDIAGADFKGIRRVRRFMVAAGTTLEHFKRRDALGEGQVRRELALIEFEDEADVENLREFIQERNHDEIGCYKLKQVY